MASSKLLGLRVLRESPHQTSFLMSSGPQTAPPSLSVSLPPFLAVNTIPTPTTWRLWQEAYELDTHWCPGPWTEWCWVGGGKTLELSQMVTRAAFDRLPGPGLRGNRGYCPPVKTPITVSVREMEAGGGVLFCLKMAKPLRFLQILSQKSPLVLFKGLPMVTCPLPGQQRDH